MGPEVPLQLATITFHLSHYFGLNSFYNLDFWTALP